MMAEQDITVTVTDVQQYEVTIVLTPDGISEAGGESVVSATVDPASPTAFAVNVTVEGSGDDTDEYEISSNKTLFFAADAEESTGSVSITAVNNNEHNDDVEVTVSGSVVPSSLTSVRIPKGTKLTIEDDDVAAPQVTLTLRPSRVEEASTTERVEGEVGQGCTPRTSRLASAPTSSQLQWQMLLYADEPEAPERAERQTSVMISVQAIDAGLS